MDAILFSAAVFAFLFFFAGKRYGFLLLIAFFLGFAADKFYWMRRPAPEARFGETEVRIADANCCRVPDIDAPGMYAGFLRRAEGEIPVGVAFPGNPVKIPYGAVLRGTARTVPVPENADDPFGRYALSRGFAACVYFDRFTITSVEKSGMSVLLAGRDFLLERMTRAIDFDDARNTAAALIFGVRGGMRGERRQKFIDSGTAHLFSVSGMHVAVLGAILLFFLRGVPFAARHALLILLLGAYTLATGANPPAVRAFWMFALWASGRMFLREIPVVETLGAIAAGMMLLSPPLLRDTGAQYSFFITALLLCAGSAGENGVAADFLMTPRTLRRERKKHGFGAMLPRALFFCAIAVAGSVGISLVAGHDVRPGAVVANLFFASCAAPLFCLGIFTFLFPGAGYVAGAAFQWIGGGCQSCAELFSGLDAVTPDIREALLFSFALLVAVGARRFVWKGTAAAVACALFVSWIVRAENQPDAIAFFSGDAASSPAIVFMESRFHRAVCFNLPGRAARPALEKELRRRGIRTIETLYLTENRRRNCGCLASLKKPFVPRRIVSLVPGEAPDKLKNYLEEYVRRTDLVPAVATENARLFPAENGFDLEYRPVRDNVKTVISVRDSVRGRRFAASAGDRALFDENRKWTKVPEIRSFDVR